MVELKKIAINEVPNILGILLLNSILHNFQSNFEILIIFNQKLKFEKKNLNFQTSPIFLKISFFFNKVKCGLGCTLVVNGKVIMEDGLYITTQAITVNPGLSTTPGPITVPPNSKEDENEDEEGSVEKVDTKKKPKP